MPAQDRVSEKRSSRQQERTNRILDAAASLILRWGYNRTTIEDIAREAGVAKGTIYLHWKTREDLFGALMIRERVEMGRDFARRVLEDPAGGMLRSIYKHAALALMKRPLLKAVLVQDMDVLGKLAHSEHGSAAFLERLTGFQSHLEFLRERGLVRTDLSPHAQVFTISAIVLGFLLAEPMLPNELSLPDEELADLISEALHCTLESDRSVSADELQAASQRFAQYVERVKTIEEERMQSVTPS